MKHLNTIPGINYHTTLPDTYRASILALEEPNNLAVKECLKKEKVLVFTHNEEFRQPLAPLIVAEGDEYLFPPQKFPELHPTAIMSSPSKKVHEFLVKTCNLQIKKDEATLLIGVDEC